jgi:hypothetical protein
VGQCLIQAFTYLLCLFQVWQCTPPVGDTAAVGGCQFIPTHPGGGSEPNPACIQVSSAGL